MPLAGLKEVERNFQNSVGLDREVAAVLRGGAFQKVASELLDFNIS